MAISCAYACIPRISKYKTWSVVRKGHYYRSSDHSYIRRYLCRSCGRTFSTSTWQPEYRQKKRHLNEIAYRELNSGVCQRRGALILGINVKTAVRKFRFQAVVERRRFRDWQMEECATPKEFVQFDDLETFEHTKCKPLSVAIAVDPQTRKILSYQVSRMPAKGMLAGIARRKYGKREDERGAGWTRLMEELKPMVNPKVDLLSDKNPHYPKFVKEYLPEAKHRTVKGRRGCVTGQGEMKRGGFDPLFTLNHTCAMLRDNLSRLVRRTWATTKTVRGLEDHLAHYVNFHNEVLVRKRPKLSAAWTG